MPHFTEVFWESGFCPFGASIKDDYRTLIDLKGVNAVERYAEFGEGKDNESLLSQWTNFATLNQSISWFEIRVNPYGCLALHNNMIAQYLS